ncbi:MAG: 1-deoxy-D-xylulose-5-phosphate reductoisomerase [Helicobacteraceae bacterium]
MILLGSTGSIGVNALEIARRYGLATDVLAAGYNHALLQKQIDEFHPRTVVVADSATAQKINHGRVLVGAQGVARALEESKDELVVNAFVGALGLMPSLKALEFGKDLALANKESLVMGGKFLNAEKITPIDSEHFGVWYLLQGAASGVATSGSGNGAVNGASSSTGNGFGNGVASGGSCAASVAKQSAKKLAKRLIITASGGAFRDWDLRDIPNASFADSQRHPNWVMGKKITVDSASMVNKLFEILECYWLFKGSLQGSANIDAVIEKRSLIHAMVGFADGSLTMHLAGADMKLPIAYALLGKVSDEIIPSLDPLQLGSFEFAEISLKRYPLWALKKDLLANTDLGITLTVANDFFVAKFIAGEIAFGKIQAGIFKALEKFWHARAGSVDDVFALQADVLRFCQTLDLH